MNDKNMLDIFQGVTPGFFSLVFNQIQEGIICLDRSMQFIFQNKTAAQMTNFEDIELMGKRCPEDVSLYLTLDGEDICKNNCPTQQTLQDGAIRSLDAYLQNKEGLRFPVSLRIIPVFSESGKILGAIETFSSTAPKVTLPYNLEELEKMRLIDGSTGIADRKYLEQTLNHRMGEFQKYQLSFGLIFADIDNYSKILEKHGRFNSGKILRSVARTIHKNIRYFDIVGRWDTEEFLIILLNIDENRLDIVANKLRLLISESYISTEMGMLSATVSMGATVVQRYDTVETIVKRAEQLMLHSKWLGKNKVSLSFVQKDVI